MLSGVETHPQYASGDGSFTSPPCGLAVSYDLINFVKKLHKVRKNPERALHVVRSDLANFFGFHRFGIKEFAEVAEGDCLQRGGELVLGRVFVFHGIKLNCDVWGNGSTDSKIKNHSGYSQPVVRQSSDGMLQRPTMLRFPTRELSPAGNARLFVGLVLRH